MLCFSHSTRLKSWCLTCGSDRYGGILFKFIHRVVGGKLVLVFMALFGSTVLHADPLTLVTLDEVRAESAARLEEPPRMRAYPMPGAPKIDILQPAIRQTSLQNPIRIELQFSSASDASIDPDSFRAYYGFLRLDLTDRIVKNVPVTQSGLTIDDVEIPSGSHRLFLQISDSKERRTEKEVRFVIE